MNYVITNIAKLTNVFSEIRGEMEKNQTISINLSWDKSSRPKTLSQLGFLFGGLVKAINNHFKELYGKEYDTDIIKEMLYNECSQVEEFYCPNGKVLYQTKRISRMTVQEMSEFIEKVIDFCDEYGIILQPELRYLWINNLDPRYVEEISQVKYPERDPEYLSAVRKESCLVCGKTYGVEAHHTKLIEWAGISTKTPDFMALPLCSRCHRYLNGDGHINTETLKALCPFIFKQIDVKTFCKLRYERWKKHRN